MLKLIGQMRNCFTSGHLLNVSVVHPLNVSQHWHHKALQRYDPLTVAKREANFLIPMSCCLKLIIEKVLPSSRRYVLHMQEYKHLIKSEGSDNPAEKRV